jgi:hypothetical protein
MMRWTNQSATRNYGTCSCTIGPRRQENRDRKIEAGGWRLEAGGWRLEAGGWRLEAGKY